MVTSRLICFNIKPDTLNNCNLIKIIKGCAKFFYCTLIYSIQKKGLPFVSFLDNCLSQTLNFLKLVDNRNRIVWVLQKLGIKDNQTEKINRAVLYYKQIWIVIFQLMMQTFFYSLILWCENLQAYNIIKVSTLNIKKMSLHLKIIIFI